jgi:hypothetical protein
MHRRRTVSTRRAFLLFLVCVLFVLPFMTGCDFIDQLLGGGIPGGGSANAPQAVMTAEIDHDLVDLGLNPDLRPPLWYQFSSAGSLSEDGIPITDPMAGFHELLWDFGDGMTIGFTPSKSAQHVYREEGTYTASLTLRAAGGATDTVQKTITIGPAWLEIVSLTTADRPDGQVNVTVVVRNQSNQALRVIGVELAVDGTLWPSNLSATFGPGTTPERLLPDGTYTLTTAVGSWTGTLTARSSFCTAWPDGQ